eukprot:TRINITY_DN19986_c0_g1_i1.p1 TRINITY_DN19986_c0_g1~~TRINITY_DN19986_c0_g1_i1.p1  ORF type:complete len:124 (+),score=1.57 TRINITY_DN19986_c0_g1_i1:165-536(+)
MLQLFEVPLYWFFLGWARYYDAQILQNGQHIVSYCIRNFTFYVVKSVSLPCSRCVLIVSMLYLSIIGRKYYLVSSLSLPSSLILFIQSWQSLARPAVCVLDYIPTIETFPYTIYLCCSAVLFI